MHCHLPFIIQAYELGQPDVQYKQTRKYVQTQRTAPRVVLNLFDIVVERAGFQHEAL
jgi:hypothetical protein